jgi:hypothetical protein
MLRIECSMTSSLITSGAFWKTHKCLGAKPYRRSAYYRDALDLALAVTEERNALLDQVGESVRLPSLVVDMNHVFEAYIPNTLGLYARVLRWGVNVYDGKLDGRKSLFDDVPRPDATPDIAFERLDKATPLIFEVKKVPGTGARSGELSSKR